MTTCSGVAAPSGAETENRRMTSEFRYEPAFYVDVPNMPHVPTSWNGLERILPDIIQRFGLKTDLAVEFGVWHGYSTACLANHFKHVIGVDPFIAGKDNFLMDKLAGTEDVPMIETTRKTLAPWANIELVESGFFEYNCPDADLIHIDIVHTYPMTFACGVLALKRTRCAIFHDTESFPEVKEAVADLAEISGYAFYNFPRHEGLGILVKEGK